MTINVSMFKRALAALAVITVISPSLATAGGALGFDEALRVAVSVHPSVQAKRNELAAAANGLDASQWQRFPALSAQSSAGQSGGKNYTTLRLEQPLWSGGRLTADVDAATARVAAAEAALGEAEQDILTRTASAFSEIIRLRGRIAAAEDNVVEHQRLLDLIQRRATSEVNSKTDVIVARARHEQARSELVQYQTQLANAMADLEQLTGGSVSALTVPRSNASGAGNLAASVQSAVEFAPALRRLAAEMQAAEAEIRAKKAVLWPQLSARHERFFGGDTTTTTNTTSTYLALNYQLGGGLSSLASIRQAEERRNAAEAARQSRRKEIEDKVRTDWNLRRSALAEREIYAELSTSTREVYESFVRQFAAGRKSWLEVLNARREATQARYSLTDAEWNGFLAGKRIDILIGQGTGNTPAALPEPMPAAQAENPAAGAASGLQAEPVDASAEITTAIDSWLAAWSSKDVKLYLAHYAQDFLVPRGQTRFEWENERTRRINKAGRIGVSRDELLIRPEGDARAVIRFNQLYKVGNHSVSSAKTMVLVLRDGKWQIQQERSEG
jgi:adhesin transport system outer membrane protein